MNLDVRGLSCPEPVLQTKAQLDQQPDTLEILLDDITPTENVTRYAQNHGYEVKRTQNGEEFVLTLQRKA